MERNFFNEKNLILIIVFLIFLCLAYQIYNIPLKETIANKKPKKNTDNALEKPKNKKKTTESAKKKNINTKQKNKIKTTESTNEKTSATTQKNIHDKYETGFHADIKDILKQTNAIKLNTYKKTIKNENGKKVDLILSNTMGNFIYNEPGKYKYGNSNFVPNYTDSILLSKTYNNYYTKV
jgi:hypothetical protein